MTEQIKSMFLIVKHCNKKIMINLISDFYWLISDWHRSVAQVRRQRLLHHRMQYYHKSENEKMII